eukprot:1157388-Pelagomonas_calceolata.AAC.13
MERLATMACPFGPGHLCHFDWAPNNGGLPLWCCTGLRQRMPSARTWLTRWAVWVLTGTTAGMCQW